MKEHRLPIRLGREPKSKLNCAPRQGEMFSVQFHILHLGGELKMDFAYTTEIDKLGGRKNIAGRKIGDNIARIIQVAV